MTIAKFRAARTLWADVIAACGIMDPEIEIGALSAVRMQTKRDPWVNILRATTACMGAAMGGADNITLYPHDGLMGLPTDFSMRITRNIQIICDEESHIGAVNDPAAGSYALETLTKNLIDKAWSLFTSLESDGGIAECLKSGLIQRVLRENSAKRDALIATRKMPVTGVSEFADVHEEPVSANPWPMGEMKEKPVGEKVEPIGCKRTAAAFEALRDRADEITKLMGSKPTVFLASMGRPSDFIARASFAKNFFAAGGIDSIQTEGFKSAKAAAEAFAVSGAKVAVLCGRDSQYESDAEDYISALKEAGAWSIYIAGKPKGLDEDVTPIYMGADVIATLTALYEKMRGSNE